MQCVILAAGKGTRLRPLTDNIPKPLVEVCGKPLIDHIASALPSAVNEIIMVIGYRGEMIKEYCGDIFHGRPVKYIEQTEINGPATALWLTKDLIKGRFLFMFADDIHGKDDLARAVSFSRSILATTSANPERFGVIVRNPDGTIAEMVEKPSSPSSNLVATGPMVLDQKIFEFPPEAPIKDEYFMPEIIMRYKESYPIAVVEENLWLAIGYPEDIATAEKKLCPVA
ncbi:MAG TPA: nucleotidyltransferase family protein [Candidatus Paceibacterota bacterium]|nr:nucleotidyltransferase family protein [Candidatus Paceibacterota bacterium]HMO83222.1 nucleotidyltransferase family protein [Candidatus Paceibacterota bacterium]